MLQGRAHELALLDDRLAAARRGHSFALLVQGEPGIGKSALLDEAVRRAAGFRVLRAAGYEAEADIPFAGVSALAAPLLELRERLPPGQARALGVALALEPPTPQDRFAVAVALLSLLSEAALRGPVLVVVDDVQWLDPTSRDTLLFVARRLGAGGIGILLAGRELARPAGDAPGVERLALGPLDGESARALLAAHDPDLARPVADWIAALSHGNPLALLELPRTLTEHQRAGRARLGDLPRPGPLLEAAFARQFAGAPADDRRAVATAAAMERGSLDWLLEALAVQEVAPSALDAAERERALLVRDREVVFRHPLVRAAAYHAASAAERAAAHRALAATAPDPPRRAWHLAAAAGGRPDEDAAAALETAALRAREVGGHAEAAWAFARAAELSTDVEARGRREVRAAEDLAIDGELDRALALVELAGAHAGPADQPAVARLRGNLAIRTGDAEAAGRLLLQEGARRREDGDAAGAATLYLEAAVAPMMTGDLAEQQRIVELARAAASEAGGAAEVLAELVAAELLIVRGHGAEGDRSLAALEPRLAEVDPLAASEIVGMAAATSMWVGAFDRAERILRTMLAAYEDAGAAGRMPYPLCVRGQLDFRRGHWSTALADLTEAVRLGRDTGQDTLLAYLVAAQARLRAWRGERDAARVLVDEGLALVDRVPAVGIAVHVQAALAAVELAAGRSEAAIAPARRAAELDDACGLRELGAGMWAIELVEALAGAGRQQELRDAVRELDERVAATGSLHGAAAVARGRLLLAPPDELDARAGEALAAGRRLGMPLERARTELAIGERLRAAGRRGDARAHLDVAAATFDTLGAVPLAARARGGDPAEPGAGGEQLSAEDHRIVQLVAAGRTNREIGAELFVSEKTVERRLSALYRRLGIRSRIQLARLASEI